MENDWWRSLFSITTSNERAAITYCAEIGDFYTQATLGAKSESNLDRWQMLKYTILGHKFQCISSRIAQLHTGKYDIKRTFVSEDELPLIALAEPSISYVVDQLSLFKYLKYSCVDSDAVVETVHIRDIYSLNK